MQLTPSVASVTCIEILASFPASPPPRAQLLINAYVNCARGGGEPGNEAIEIHVFDVFSKLAIATLISESRISLVYHHQAATRKCTFQSTMYM